MILNIFIHIQIRSLHHVVKFGGWSKAYCQKCWSRDRHNCEVQVSIKILCHAWHFLFPLTFPIPASLLIEMLQSLMTYCRSFFSLFLNLWSLYATVTVEHNPVLLVVAFLLVCWETDLLSHLFLFRFRGLENLLNRSSNI